MEKRRRSLMGKLAAVLILAGFELSAPQEAVAAVQSGTCGYCMSSCPSAFTWDSWCHALCGHTSMGWCPASGDGPCDTFQVFLKCSGGNQT